MIHKISAKILASVIFLTICLAADAQTRQAVVVDSLSRRPLPRATVFDRGGKAIGITSDKGILPTIPAYAYPVTVRYLGYHPHVISSPAAGEIAMRENASRLAEIVVRPGKREMLHLLAYVREYSTFSSYGDTVRLFREKNVDFMIPVGKKTRYKGWASPRLLRSKSYYRFTDSTGLDSVSDYFYGNFSWTDWIGIVAREKIPAALAAKEAGTDTVMGRVSPAAVWRKNGESIRLDIDILSDSTCGKWVPSIPWTLLGNLGFNRLEVGYLFDEVYSGQVSADNLSAMSAYIESTGRGAALNRFFHNAGTVYVETHAEVFFIDKEYISVKEARRWEKKKEELEADEGEILTSDDIPLPDAATLALMDRVESIDHTATRLKIIPDQRLVGRKELFKPKKRGFLKSLKSLIM